MQNEFLKQLKKCGCNVSIYLLNGNKLEGKIIGFDNFTILIIWKSRTSLIYKQSLVSIRPADHFKFYVNDA